MFGGGPPGFPPRPPWPPWGAMPVPVPVQPGVPGFAQPGPVFPAPYTPQATPFSGAPPMPALPAQEAVRAEGVTPTWDDLARSSRLGRRHVFPQGAVVGQAERLVDIRVERPSGIVVYVGAAQGQQRVNGTDVNLFLRITYGNGAAILVQEMPWVPRGMAMQFHASTLSVECVVVGTLPSPGWEVAASASPGYLQRWKQPGLAVSIPNAGSQVSVDIPSLVTEVEVATMQQDLGTLIQNVYEITFADAGGAPVPGPGAAIVLGTFDPISGSTVPYNLPVRVPVPLQAVQMSMQLANGFMSTNANGLLYTWEMAG